MSEYKKGDTIRLNMMGAKDEKVMHQTGNMITTTTGNHYHKTKVVPVKKKIEELSRDTLHNYVRKAADDLAYSSDVRDDQKKREFVTKGMEKLRSHMLKRTNKNISKRAKGIQMATNKIVKEDDELNESTRKHFRAAAETIKAIEDPEKRKEHANMHAEIYAKQNPRFDRGKFMKAAGVNEDIDDIEIEDENLPDDDFTYADQIVMSAITDTPLEAKEAFNAAILQIAADRVGQIRDDMRERIFANEEEDLDEISKEKTNRYLDKAISDHGMSNNSRRNTSDPDEKKYYANRERKRKIGISRAIRSNDKKSES